MQNFNVPMEGFWGIVKSEMYYLSKFEDFETLKTAIDRYIYYYNNERYQAGLKNMTPVEFRSHA